MQVRLSKFKIGDLALRSAWELERARSHLPFSREPLRELAEALEKSSAIGGTHGSVAYMRPGYFEPLERVYRMRHSNEPESLEGVQRFVHDATISLKNFVAQDATGEVDSQLVDFCLELHRAFIRRMPAEGRHEHTNRSISIEALIR